MIKFDNNILDKRFCDHAKTTYSKIHEISKVLDKIDADEIFKILNELSNTKQ